MIPITPSMLWLLFGVALIILEFSQVPGIGFLFLGLGGISTSIITNYWQEETLLTQFAYFGIASLAWFMLLWYPLKTFLSSNKNKLLRDTFDIVGSDVVVINKDIKTGTIGQVSWCGTTMNAKLAENAANNTAKVGDTLIVQEVKGNVLICKIEI